MRSSRAFTLIEVMAAVAIFAIMAGIVLANFRGSSKAAELRASADELAARIKSAQNMAASNMKQQICALDGKVCRSGSACDAGYPANCAPAAVSSYGVKIDPQGSGNDYVVFADLANPGTYDPGEALPNATYAPSRGVEIVSVDPAGNDPVVFTYNAANSSPFVACSADCTTTVTLRQTTTGNTITVVIRKQTGIITVQ